MSEIWFLIEGLLWARIAWLVLGPSRARRRFMGTAVGTIAVLVVFGLLAGFGVTGRLVVL